MHDDEETGSLIAEAPALSNDDPEGESDELWDVIRGLHERPVERVFEAASRWCRSSAPLERRLGADVLGQLGHAEGESPFGARSLPILESMLGEDDPRVLQSTIVALSHLADHGVEWDGALLEPLAAHADPAVREAVAFALGGELCDRSAAALAIQLRLVRDTDPDVRSWAAFGIARSEADTPEIRRLLIDGLADSDPEVRGEAMAGLARRKDLRVVEAILTELASDDVTVLAIEAAAELPRSEFLPHLEALNEAHPDDSGIREALRACREDVSSCDS